jgi:hypothetical protein
MGIFGLFAWCEGPGIFGKDRDKLATPKRAIQIISCCAQNFGIIK